MAKQWHVEDAERFVGAHAYDLSQDEQVLSNLRCVDCREHRQLGDTVAPLPAIAIPGAGLGLFMDTLAAMEYAARRERQAGAFDPFLVHEAVCTVIGSISLHTDDAAQERGDILCGGCVYCGSSLRNSEKFLLSEGMIRFLREEYLHRIASDHRRRKEEIVSYSGQPTASAVFIIDDDDVGLPAQGSGQQAYIYHRSWHHRGLLQCAVALYPCVKDMFVSVSEEQWHSYMLESAAIRLSNAIGYVAEKLPKYQVYRTPGKAVLVKPLDSLAVVRSAAGTGIVEPHVAA